MDNPNPGGSSRARPHPFIAGETARGQANLSRRTSRSLTMHPSPPIHEVSAMRILCAGAMHRIVDELMNALERLSGRPVAARFASFVAVKTRMLEGECTDVVITTKLAIEELGRHHKIVPGTTTDVARSAIGAAVRAGALRPDIGSIESFKRALRDANSIAIADPITGSPSGNHLVGVFDRLGMTPELDSKIKRVGGGASGVVVVGDAVAACEAEIGFQQIAEILAVPGIDLIGELPPDLQCVTVFSAAVAANATDETSARRLIEFLVSSTARSVINAKGMRAGINKE